MKLTYLEFNRRYPSSDACLEQIKQMKYQHWSCPKCGRVDRLSKIKGRPQYACVCGKQVSPLVGTIFSKSPVDLRTWFLAIYLVSQTRSGMSSQQLMRMTGVNKDTAWRMMKQIRTLMADDDGDLLTGVVEIDEAYVGGVGGVRKGLKGKAATGQKFTVLGMVERGGRVRAKVVPSDRGEYMLPHIRDNVSKSATLMTDQHRVYVSLPHMGYIHYSLNHNREFAIGPISTNTIEGFWSTFKNGIRGVYKHVSAGYIQSYADEYSWRYSNRKSEIPMFDLLLGLVAKV